MPMFFGFLGLPAHLHHAPIAEGRGLDMHLACLFHVHVGWLDQPNCLGCVCSFAHARAPEEEQRERASERARLRETEKQRGREAERMLVFEYGCP